MAGKSTKATRSKYLQDIAKHVDKARELADALPRADGWGGGLHLPGGGGFGYGNLSDLLSDLGATIRDAAASAQSGQSSHATTKKLLGERAVRTKTHHATKKPKIGYFIRSRGLGGVEFDEVYVYGPTRRSDEGIVGHDLRVRPTRLGPGTYTSVVSPDDVEWKRPIGRQPTTQEIKQDVDRILAESVRRKQH